MLRINFAYNDFDRKNFQKILQTKNLHLYEEQ